MSLEMKAAWAQLSGTREYQEDCAAVTRWDNGFHLFLLADGMGGHIGGMEASHIVVSTMRETFIKEIQSASLRSRSIDALIDALQAANLAIYDQVAKHPELDGMGCTIVAATFDGETLDWLSVGDSALYLFRENELQRLNRDHSMAAVLAQKVASGEISMHDAATAPERSELLEAVMGQDISLVDTPDAPLLLRSGDILLLATDGLDVLDPDAICTHLSGKTDHAPEALVDGLLSAVSASGRTELDNTTLIVATVKSTHGHP